MYDLSKIKPIGEKNGWKLYVLGFINESTRKGVLVNTKTNEQLECKVETLIDKNKTSFIVTDCIDPRTLKFLNFNHIFEKSR